MMMCMSATSSASKFEIEHNMWCFLQHDATATVILDIVNDNQRRYQAAWDLDDRSEGVEFRYDVKSMHHSCRA